MDEKFFSIRNLIIFIFIILILLLILFYLNKYSYKKFNLENNPNEIKLSPNSKTCEIYFAKCYCIGILTTQESYPPSYNCDGFEYCSKYNKRICEDVE